MDEDDEFGDLYTDVLQPFSNSSTSALPPPQPLLQLQPKRASPPPPPPSSSSVDLNPDDDDEILYGASGRGDQTLVNSAPNSRPDGKLSVMVGGGSDSRLGINNKGLEARGISTDFLSGEPDKDLDFDIEEGGNAGEDSGLLIPGLGVDMVEDSKQNGAAAGVGGMGGSGRGVKEGGDEEWDEEDSDSEDDLQIVLNDTGPMGMDRGMMGDGEEDEDDDGDPLVIVADGDPNQGMGEPDWGGGDEAAADAGGEGGDKKEGGEAAGKGNAMVAGAKIGYNNHGYHHTFHSQFKVHLCPKSVSSSVKGIKNDNAVKFWVIRKLYLSAITVSKYVRPGAAPMPGVTTGPPGAPGQLRPPISLGSMPGRGRGDWRPMGNKSGPPMQKGFPGYGGWGNNMGGRGFGGGLDFTLPSHKTIFDVDIDNFEEKPWKYPGVDITDFFNFGLNEESWKDYCRQLEQHRLETTMQSKIRVYESGRAEQEFDPDLPPELAAAAGGHDVSVDNSNIGKTDLGQSDLAKGSARARPPIPTGRPIPVETGFSDRQPSIDTRPPRLRDSDAIIEIQLQGSLEDDSSGNDALDGENSGGSNRGSRVPDDHEVMAPKAEDFVDPSQAHPNLKGGRKAPYMDKDTDGDVPRASQSDAPSRYRPSFRGQAPVYPGGDLGTSHEERRKQRTNGRSPHLTSSRSADEESVESMGGDGRRSSQQLSSPTNGREVRESSVGDKDCLDAVGDFLPAEGSSGIAKGGTGPNDFGKDRSTYHSKKKQRVERSSDIPLQEDDAQEEEDSKAARSSENSKARSSSSSKDYHQKWQDGVDDEVVQGGGRSTSIRPGSSIKRHPKDMDGRQETERSRVLSKSREGSYTRKELDPSIVGNHLQSKGEGYDRRKDRDNLDGAWQQRRQEDSSVHNRKTKPEEMKKRERGDEIGSSRHRKVRESERSEKDEHLISRKQLDNGNYRAHFDNKDGGGSRHRGREDSVKHRYEIPEDYHSKRKKDEEYIREEMLHGHRESSSSHRRRERDDQQRIPRDSMEDYHSSGRHNKDEAWLSRERNDKPREREELLYRPKQSTHEEHFSKREKDEGGRGSVRNGRGIDEKAWIGNARGKDEYFAKDSVRNSEQLKKRERVEDVRGGNQVNNKERKSSRHEKEKSSARTDRAVDTPDNHRSSDKRHKEATKKLKEPEGADYGTLGSSIRSREDKTSQANNSEVKDSSDRQNDNKQNQVQRNSSKRAKEDASSDEEQPDSKKGRSKLERWTSHKEKEFNMNNKSAPSAKLKNGDKNDDGGPSEKVQSVERQHPVVEEKDGGGDNTENKDGDKKQLDDRHLETVEKLKKRSERFKLPLPLEKDGSTTVKKIETPDALPPMPPVNKTEPVADAEVKPERPARRRRWVGN
ncbi:unnamed protein product [Linum tenue]|uniref:Pre-mRNA polyadenylation factor Fip1 domain-containing protein n=1 Tax=Linum tenue TaxID=586396 RepID=A0AAV0QC15_9ROSI|nr:unnamed protein product [Linum tenue]